VCICRLSNLLKEAMQYGQVGKPTIHLVEVMEAVDRPFFMFVCSNCFCDICDKVRTLGYWSPAESQIFHHVLRRHGCKDGKALVIDVGAHVGYFSLIAASYGCRVVSFEPNSVALRYLNLSTAINNFDRVSLHQKGVGQADTQAMYKQTDTWALNGFLKKRRKLSSVQAPDVLMTEANMLNSDSERADRLMGLNSGFGRRRILETVDVTMLDSIVDEDVLLIKIDTEGYEANVFAGAKNLLSQHRIHHILAEVKQANSPSKRGLLYTIFKEGGFTHVYNWNEVIEPLSVPFEQFTLRNATIVDVTSIVVDQTSYAPLNFQDFWFCREPLPWL
jgi:FkbM family methyltransferase